MFSTASSTGTICALLLLSTTCAAVTIVSRSGWQARPPKARTTLWTPVPKVFIHHSDGPKCYTQASCSRVVRGIQNYHMDTKGWSDIGYNFLVGGDGNVYEGRGWNVVGAQTRGFNSVSIGICLLGDFMRERPNAAALIATQSLLVEGVRLNKIASSYELYGHRQARDTVCPGDNLYSIIQGWPKYSSHHP